MSHIWIFCMIVSMVVAFFAGICAILCFITPTFRKRTGIILAVIAVLAFTAMIICAVNAAGQCPYCGTYTDSTYCQHCGKYIEEHDQFCAKCGEYRPDNYCGKCGTPKTWKPEGGNNETN